MGPTQALQIRESLGPHESRTQPGRAPGAALRGNKVSVGLDVLAQRAGVGVALHAAAHLAAVRLVHVVRARVLEAVAGVGVTFAAAVVRTDVGFFSWRRDKNFITG